MNQQFGPLLYTISVWALPAIIAITFHEAAHGFVARLLGDDTAWRLGRVTFNPLKHIDPFGTILLPGLLLFLHSRFLFGYAKPVPINFRALRNPRRDMVLVAVVRFWLRTSSISWATQQRHSEKAPQRLAQGQGEPRRNSKPGIRPRWRLAAEHGCLCWAVPSNVTCRNWPLFPRGCQSLLAKARYET
jgi:hypothetical protein